MANISFGERLRRGRIKNAWTQVELAQKLGVTQVTISTWETGRIQLDRQQKIKVREILGLNSPDVGNAREDQTEVQTDDQTGPSAFGTWLNKTRIEGGLSVAELALKAEVSAPAIYNIESGRIENPRKETLRRLEQALGKELPAEAKKEIRDEATIEGFEFMDFDPHDRKDWPEIPGIYVLYDISERPIYVGQGSSIKKRIQDHEEKFWFKSPIVSTAAFIRVDDDAWRKKIEIILIRFLKRNAVINKQNVDR